MNQPTIKVGILTATEIKFTLKGLFRIAGGNKVGDASFIAMTEGGHIHLKSDGVEMRISSGFTLVPDDYSSCQFTVHGVVIGVNFHWERAEDQSFMGSICLIAENDRITIINILPVEDYLISVISSEMKATSSAELLKAHSVVSRGWLLAQINKKKILGEGEATRTSGDTQGDEIVRWYDREDHENFDVCADDHCQRYQGITRASSEQVLKAVRSTTGEVVTYNGDICDTRYYKCCGGITELFENVWEPVNHPYLQKITDTPVSDSIISTNLEVEDEAMNWINSSPDSFCNTSDKTILAQVLNDYDQETHDFFRWKVTYSQEEIDEIVKGKTGIDFGQITDLVPLTRGEGGRIIRLRIAGTKRTMIIGKELEIRKALSKSHLYSSFFYVEKRINNGSASFILHGAGWGHGVGLCQIGAAVMGARGYSYKDILTHYFRGSIVGKLY
ncbi:MAG: SpoIID/LytB domain-containing protein [Bacteroidales bacterium]